MDIPKKNCQTVSFMGTTKTSEEFLTQYFKKEFCWQNNFKFSYLVLRSFSFSNSVLVQYSAKKCPVAKLIAFLYLTGKYLILLHHPELLNKTLISMANDQK